MSVDLVREAEAKAKEMFHDSYNVDDLIRRRAFVTELGNIAKKSSISMYSVNFENSFKKKSELSELAEYFKEMKVEGFTLKDSKQIYIDDQAEPERQRFTAAHELGHIVLGHFDEKGMSVAFRDLTSSPRLADEKELAANFFAAELLMPEDLMVEAIRYTKSPVELAGFFGVTRGAMARRIARLKDLGVI